MLRRAAGLALLLALTACGHAPAPAVQAATAHTLVVAGVERAMGYDVDRYRRVLAAKAHLEHVQAPATLPTAVDLRPWCAPVYDQGNVNACTAFSMAKGLREFYQHRRGEAATPLSALWFYYKERLHMGPEYVGHDGGANLVDGMSVLTTQGAAPDALWPYKLRFVTTAPPAEADAAAPGQKLAKATQLAGFADMKASLALGHPVAFGFVVTESLRRTGPDGIMPVPQPGDSIIGGHAVLAVGYDDARQLLTVRNSWGTDFGDHGYFYMPYAIATDTSYMLESWTAE